MPPSQHREGVIIGAADDKYRLSAESVVFVRPPRNSDYNSLVKIVSASSHPSDPIY